MRLWFRFPDTPSSDATRLQRRRSLLLAVALIAVLPLAWRGISCGQDFDFHLQSWLEVVDHWRAGILYPHWDASANYLAGEPRFVFYPPLSWMLGAVLGLLLPWSWTPLVYIAVALLAAAFAFRAMAREWMPADSATIAACLYVVNPYMLFVVYERGALAELLAAVWIPLLVLFALRERPAFVPLTVTIAALWLTDAPAGVMGSYALLLLVAVAALRARATPKRMARLLGRTAAALPLALGLTAFWLVPAAYEERWVEIRRVLAPLMRVEDSFLFRFSPTAAGTAQERFEAVYHNQVLDAVSWIALVLIAAAAVAAWRSRRSRNLLWAPCVALAAAVVFLQFPASDFLWRALPELKYLQFPWRWLLVLALAFSVLAGLALRSEQTTRRAVARRAALLLLLAGVMAGLSAFAFWQPCDEDDNIPAQIAALHTTGFEGTDEYTPAGAVNAEIQQGLPVIRLLRSASGETSPSRDNPSWTADPAQEIPGAMAATATGPEHIDATVATFSSGYVVFRLMDYPAWRVTVNGTEVRNRPHRSDGLMVVPIAAGTSRIAVAWRTTRDEWTGILLSCIALAITLVCWGKGRRQPRGNSFP